MPRLTALVLILIIAAPFLPFECVCCDLHGESDCCLDGSCAHHQADSPGSVTMQPNRPPSDAHGGCFCGEGVAHALAGLTSPKALFLESGTATEPEFVRAGVELDGLSVPASPDVAPPTRPPQRSSS